MEKEIERKWIAYKGKNYENFIFEYVSKAFIIEQFYTKIEFKEEIRFRKIITKGFGSIRDVKKSEYNMGNKARDVFPNEKIEYEKEIKIGEGLSRECIKSVINEEEYESNKKLKVGNLIVKIRYKVPKTEEGEQIESYYFEIDEYINPKLENRVIIEIEFANETQAYLFHFDRMFESIFLHIQEVTHNSNFKNKNIALKGEIAFNGYLKNG